MYDAAPSLAHARSRTSSRTRTRFRAAALGVITGFGFGATAALIKAVGEAFGRAAHAVFTTWPLYALLLIGPIGFAVNQVAFQAGPLSASLPAMSAVDPLASVILGSCSMTRSCTERRSPRLVRPWHCSCSRSRCSDSLAQSFPNRSRLRQIWGPSDGACSTQPS